MGAIDLKVIRYLLAASLLLSPAVFAATAQTIYIEVVGKGEFEVIYHRALSNALGAAIGGVIGAGIQSGVEANKDVGKADQLRPLIKQENWRVHFLAALNDKLEAEGFEAVWVDDRKEIGKGSVLKIYPENYGFRMVDTTSQLVSAFIDFKAAYSSDGSADELDKEKYYLTDKNQYPFDDLLKENSPANADLEALLEKAARRLANKIIYSLKE